MHASDFQFAWPWDTEHAHALRTQLLDLEQQRAAVVSAQRALKQQLVDERVAMAGNVDPLVQHSLAELMDSYRAVLAQEGMAYEGTLEAHVLTLRASDMHKAHQSKGRPWCWIGAAGGQIEWTSRTIDARTRHSPEVTSRQVAAHCERVGLEGNAWDSDCNGLGVSLVVTRLVEPGAGMCVVTR